MVRLSVRKDTSSLTGGYCTYWAYCTGPKKRERSRGKRRQGKENLLREVPSEHGAFVLCFVVVWEVEERVARDRSLSGQQSNF